MVHMMHYSVDDEKNEHWGKEKMLYKLEKLNFTKDQLVEAFGYPTEGEWVICTPAYSGYAKNKNIYVYHIYCNSGEIYLAGRKSLNKLERQSLNEVVLEKNYRWNMTSYNHKKVVTKDAYKDVTKYKEKDTTLPAKGAPKKVEIRKINGKIIIDKELDYYTVAELKAMCKECKLSRTGKKYDLVIRLMDDGIEYIK